MNGRGIPIAALLLSGLAVLFFVDREYRAQVRKDNADALAQESVLTRTRLRVAVDRRLYIVEDLAAFMLAPATLPDRETFDRFAANVLRHYPEIRALQYVDPQRIIRYIYPLAGNEAALGLDLMTRPAALFVERAIAQRRMTINDPTVTVQGSLSIIPRNPLFRDGRLLGLVQAVIDINAIVKEVQSGIDPRFVLQLHDARGRLFWGPGGITGVTRSARVPVGDNIWTETLGWRAPPAGSHTLVLGLIWGLGGALLLSLVYIQYRNWAVTRTLRATVAERTAELAESEERYRLLVDNSGDAILLTGSDGAIYSANPEACRIFGRSEDDLRSQGRRGVANPADPELQAAIEERRRTGRFAGELSLLRNDGAAFPAEVSTTVFTDSRGHERTSMIIRDISERKLAERKLRASLAEKEALIREIHHRVKNNLQMMSALLELQSAYLKDDLALSYFRNSQQRIQSMALIHEQLYRHADADQIDVAAYLRGLVDRLRGQYGALCERVEVQVEAEPCVLSVENAVPLGLAVNELVTNAMKHAFPGGRPGRVLVALSRTGERGIRLEVADDGVGMGMQLAQSGFGMRLVRMMVEQQLQGTLSIQSRGGTRFVCAIGGRQ